MNKNKIAPVEAETASTEPLDSSVSETVVASEPTEAPAEIDYKAEAEKWRGYARKWETRAKNSEQATVKLKETEAQAAQYRAQLDQIQQEKKHTALLAQVSKETGVPASVLRGDTLEDLQEHAKQVQELLKPHTDEIHLNDEPSRVVEDQTRAFLRQLFSKD